MHTEKSQYITNIKNQLLRQMTEHEHTTNDIYELLQCHLAYHSNKIENSMLTKYDTTSIFDLNAIFIHKNDIIRTKDIEETTGHFRMFRQTLQTLDQPLSTNIIKQMHYDLKIGVFEDMANGYPCGEFKNKRNYVSTVETALPEDVPARIDELISQYNLIQNPTVKDLAAFHVKYEKIHPFQDGNGRTGRMILFRESLKHDMIPIIIQSENKNVYMNALHKSQTKHDIQSLTHLLEQEQIALYEATKDIVS